MFEYISPPFYTVFCIPSTVVLPSNLSSLCFPDLLKAAGKEEKCCVSVVGDLTKYVLLLCVWLGFGRWYELSVSTNSE